MYVSIPKHIEASEQTSSKPCVVTAVMVDPEGNAGHVYLRDGDSGGTIVWHMHITAAAAIGYGLAFPHPLSFENGIYVEVTGTIHFCIAYKELTQ